MKITSISRDEIIFNNGNSLTHRHLNDCCEENYADFSQVDDLAICYEFDEDLVFECVEDYGFRFGNKDGNMFFVPCYSVQNGYYSSEVEIHYWRNARRNTQVFDTSCKIIYK